MTEAWLCIGILVFLALIAALPEGAIQFTLAVSWVALAGALFWSALGLLP